MAALLQLCISTEIPFHSNDMRRPVSRDCASALHGPACLPVDRFGPVRTIYPKGRGVMELQVDKAVRADQAADAALAMLLDHPREAVTLEALAERAGLKYWQVHRFHGNAGNLYRAAIA